MGRLIFLLALVFILLPSSALEGQRGLGKEETIPPSTQANAVGESID